MTERIDYDAYAKLIGTAPAAGRGGEIAAGKLSDMVSLGLERLSQGYVNVRVMFDDGSLGDEEIKRVAKRADFPK